MQVYQYTRIHQSYIPPEVLDEYNLTSKHFDSKGFAYLEIRKGMYGLKEAAILAYDQLKNHLANMATSHLSIHLTCGITQLDHLLSHWLSMTLESNTFLSRMQIISSLHCKTNTQSPLTGQVSPYIGLNINWQYEKGLC